jgi:hypothetical protein
MGCLAAAKETLGRSLVLPTVVFVGQNGIKDVYSGGGRENSDHCIMKIQPK